MIDDVVEKFWIDKIELINGVELAELVELAGLAEYLENIEGILFDEELALLIGDLKLN